MGEEAITRKNPFRILFKEELLNLGENRKVYFFYIFLFFLVGIIRLLEPLVVGLIFNASQEQIMNEAELWTLIGLISLLLIITVVSWIIHGYARYLEQRTGFLVQRNYTNRKIERVLELPVSWHKDHHSGDTIDKINKGKSSISEFSMYTKFQIINIFMNLIGSAVILVFFDKIAAIVAFSFSMLTLFIIVKIDRRLSNKYKEKNKLENDAAAAVYDYIGNIITVITLRLKKTVRKEIDKKVMAPYKIHNSASVLNELKWAFAGISIQLMIVVLLSYRVYTDFYSGKMIMVGSLYILYSYLSIMGNTFYNLAWLYGDIVRAGASIENAKPIEDEYKKVKSSHSGDLGDNWREVSINNLNFSYDYKGKKNHLEDIEFSFKKGEKIALVGESGSGKSTFLSLLRSLYDPDSVEVSCDGKILKNNLHPISNSITLIPQDPEIFNNSVKFNIAMGLPHSKEEIRNSIRMAQLSDVVKKLPKKLETNVLEKGVSLSGGEKQRLALARGLLAAKDSDIILMDEPTSSVDSLNEMKIHDNIFKEFKDKTIISSVHRLHLLSKFDKIYFFQRGKIVASGTLKEMKKYPRFNYLLKKYWNK